MDGLVSFFVADDSEEFFAEPEGPESGVLVFGDSDFFGRYVFNEYVEFFAGRAKRIH